MPIKTDAAPSRGTFYEQLARVTNDMIEPSVYSIPITRFEDDRLTSNRNQSEAAGTAPPGHVLGEWSQVRRGMIYTRDPAKPLVANAFTMHYNPSSLTVNTVVDFSLPTSFSPSTDGSGGALIDSGIGNPPSNAESLSFQIFLNRIIEVGLNYTGPSHELFQQYGTLVDLNILFRVLNGLNKGDVEAILKVGNFSVPPLDIGYLTATRCEVSFGNTFIWNGYCQSINVTHEKFINSMAPVLTTVTISFQRSLAADYKAPTPGDTTGNDITTGATQGVDATGTNYLGTGTTDPGQSLPGIMP